METRYLKRCLGRCLSQALAEVAKYRPLDPIEYIAFWIYKYKKNLDMEEVRQVEQAELEEAQELARVEREMLERLKQEELLLQQQKLELEMQEKERLRLEAEEKARREMEKKEKLILEELGKIEFASEPGEDIVTEGGGLNKTLAEISDRYGAPNLTRVEELEEPSISDAALDVEKEDE
ncbi:DPY30 domain-containing protein 1 isoform X2 [Monodelphis domestica]|uniref:DPY30 domain-containing protein 1 isoform X2 n=1 Tax=Monodelphis domestica TaxID=13616 RepID=UPI00028BE87A|nr:DPY30 domain-containing protein 1 isoform X2 [Monodelphis domestica]